MHDPEILDLLREIRDTHDQQRAWLALAEYEQEGKGAEGQVLTGLIVAQARDRLREKLRRLVR